MVKSAFTLIELLVCIAIIAVLAAILIPVVNSAKQRSHMATNVSNLRQIGTAASMWSTDHGGAVVPTYDPGDAWPESSNNWTGLLAPYLGWTGVVTPNTNIFTSAEDMPVYVNPEHPERWGYGHNTHGLRFVKRDPNSRFYNPNATLGLKLEDPARTVFFTTSRKGEDDDSFHTGWRAYVREPGGLEDFVVDYGGVGEQATVLWLDGHVSTETEDSLGEIELWETEATVGN